MMPPTLLARWPRTLLAPSLSLGCVAGLLIMYLTVREAILPAVATLVWFMCAALTL